VFIIAIDGAVVADENFGNLLLDVAVLRSLNIRIVLVHGAGHQIKILSERLQEPISNYDGAGVTDAATLGIAITAATNVTHEILEGLKLNDIRAAQTNAVEAVPLGIIKASTTAHGQGPSVDIEMLRTLLDKALCPSSLRSDSTETVTPTAEFGRGRGRNGPRARRGQADVHRQRERPRNRRQGRATNIGQGTGSGAEEFRGQVCARNDVQGAACAPGSQSGVPRVHIISGQVDEGLLAEVFSNEGIGTLIYTDEYQAIRKAMRKDLRHIMALIKPSIQEEQLIKRTRSSSTNTSASILSSRSTTTSSA